jgi:hypothetical protein
MELKHGILNEEEIVVVQIRELERAKEALSTEIIKIREEMERSTKQM